MCYNFNICIEKHPFEYLVTQIQSKKVAREEKLEAALDQELQQRKIAYPKKN